MEEIVFFKELKLFSYESILKKVKKSLDKKGRFNLGEMEEEKNL